MHPSWPYLIFLYGDKTPTARILRLLVVCSSVCIDLEFLSRFVGIFPLLLFLSFDAPFSAQSRKLFFHVHTNLSLPFPFPFLPNSTIGACTKLGIDACFAKILEFSFSSFVLPFSADDSDENSYHTMTSYTFREHPWPLAQVVQDLYTTPGQ